MVGVRSPGLRAALTAAVAAAVGVAVAAGVAPASGIALAGPHARVAAAPTVPTVRCRTEFGLPPPHHRVPPRVTVQGHPRSVAGLVAYTNTELFLIAPAGMACSGIVAADGGTEVVLWPKGQRLPTQHSHEAGMSLTLEPACTSCRAGEACPFFPAFARGLQFPCTITVPPRETVERVGQHLVLFEDPPGAPGDGYPSGGPDPANGLVGITSRYQEVYRSTCTLPASRHQVCTTSLNDVIGRYR